jgi:hypothetical protein
MKKSASTRPCAEADPDSARPEFGEADDQRHERQPGEDQKRHEHFPRAGGRGMFVFEDGRFLFVLHGTVL